MAEGNADTMTVWRKNSGITLYTLQAKTEYFRKKEISTI